MVLMVPMVLVVLVVLMVLIMLILLVVLDMLVMLVLVVLAKLAQREVPVPFISSAPPIIQTLLSSCNMLLSPWCWLGRLRLSGKSPNKATEAVEKANQRHIC